MRYDFNKEIDRVGTNAAKWDVFKQGDQFLPLAELPPDPAGRRLLPLWVADMDFRCPQPVIDALAARVQHGIFGYTLPDEGYYEAVVGWMARRQGWPIEPSWIVPTPGVVPALNWLVSTFVAPGQRVIIQPPVYYPFTSAIENQGRAVARNPLVQDETGRYQMDFEGLAALVAQPDVTMLILCSPHNPIGRIWTAEELHRLGTLCLENDVLVVADEIHGDLILPGHHFTPYGTLGEALAQNAVICTAPSKSFNLAGLATSNLIIPNAALRERFQQTILHNGIHGVNLFGMTALKAAYAHGEEWLDQLLAYIAGNYDYLRRFVADYLPQLRVSALEGSYLAWLDCRALGLDAEALERLMLDEARLFLDEGYIFGPEGEGFERINLACPRSLLAEALERLYEAVGELQ